jgi:hypothetical protein
MAIAIAARAPATKHARIEVDIESKDFHTSETRILAPAVLVFESNTIPEMVAFEFDCLTTMLRLVFIAVKAALAQQCLENHS